mmetsp:Transcript_327/g.408  ORF Transcript_327/g.408 Transcript_327/m.408 type:complete len:313 (-) Transcript_327:463-1401(-)
MAAKTILVTGANSGLGFDTCRLAVKRGASKVILACRNRQRAEAAVDKLVILTGKPKSTFEILIIDTSSLKICREAAANVTEPLDAAILNAGGSMFKIGGDINNCGAHNQFTINVIGHAVFVDELIKKNMFNKGAHITFISSFAARGFPLFGLKEPKLKKPYVEDMKKHITGAAYEKFDALNYYGYTKAIGCLYFSKLAELNPDLVINSVSPGATRGTSGANEMSLFTRIWFHFAIDFVLRFFTGDSHALKVGTERYLDAAGMGPLNVPTGKFYASPKNKTSGKICDQGEFYSTFADQEQIDAAYEAVQSFMK